MALVCCLIAGLAPAARAQSPDSPIQQLLQEHRAVILKSSRTSIGPAIDALATSGLPEARAVLNQWQDKNLWVRKSDGLFVFGQKADGGLGLVDITTGERFAVEDPKTLDQLKPNSGIRGLIGAALVQFQLTDPDPRKRAEGLRAIERRPKDSHLEALRKSIPSETDPGLLARKERLERLLTIQYGAPADRVAAIESFRGSLSVDVRAALNPLLATRVVLAEDAPANANVARPVVPGSPELSRDQAFDLLAEARGLARPPDAAARKEAMIAHIDNGAVGGVPVAALDTDAARDRAYTALAEAGLVPAWSPADTIDTALDGAEFLALYREPDPAVTAAAEETLKSIETKLALNQGLDLTLDALSLASIYFLAAIGLAITFGVMGVINMAHGEFIMMGAYTGYVVQQVIPDYTLSLIVALPLAFCVTAAAGIAMERLVIRHLYHRPLETLLATFGISIALQQLAKTIFGTQARPLTSPGWLDGAFTLNDVVSISYIRIAIFVLALLFLALFLFIMKKTRLGLEVRAVTQNPRMAASMGINPGRINMLTFALGSGIAGIAGVAIGLYAKVTSEMGADYIVQSFMTVVVGGVGNIWGTLIGATGIGFLQKGIEFLNPSNTLAAQTYMIVFIIIFIQFRPRGIIALRGRAAGD
ncbi:urea ABC transporter permease subunit UrtB [Oceaniglobus roseus]|uniref:urea ABC transporter permease subunit UrtB n=1 Tax=Oceaniglobus roseus TaxID=1737570 RepID=UPI003CCC250A